MNRVEVFKKIKTHLLTQNQKSYDAANDICLYHMGKLRCAIGCLIPDDKYDQAIEGAGVSDIRDLLVEILDCALTDEDIFFLEDLQRIHDDIEPYNWPDALDEFEQDYNLKELP